MYGKSVLFSRISSYFYSVRYYKAGGSKKLLEILAEMPKVNSTRIAESQRQRVNIQKKSEKYAPSTVYLQVLGSGAHGVPNTLYLFTDQRRYLFNCGECTQRLAHEHKVKLSRLDHIFITNKSWKNIGGLPGLSLTLQDVGVPNITLHGPQGLDDLYAATKRFVIMKDMNVTMAPCDPTIDFEDNAMTVKYIYVGNKDPVLPNNLSPNKKKKPNIEKEYEEFIHDNTDYYRSNKHNNDQKLHEKQKMAKSRDEKELEVLTSARDCAVAYVCTLKKRLGTLDLAKCVEYGVKPGPMLGELKCGRDVILEDGTLVQSKNVKTPDDPGPVFIVLEVQKIEDLWDREFAAHFDDGVNPPESIPVLIAHFTAPPVFNHPKYRDFMAKFGPNTQHLVLNEQNNCLGSEAVHRTQHKLHLLDPHIFPLLRDLSIPTVWNANPPLPNTNSPLKLKELEELKKKFQSIVNMETSKGDGVTVETSNDGNSKLETIAGRSLMIYHLRPKKGLDRTAEPKLHIQDYIQETMDVDGFAGSMEQFQKMSDTLRYRNESDTEYPKVVFLGTGSCIPSKTRNTSAIVIQIDENRSMLLDCGEGTYGQIVRFFGAKRANAFLRTLKAIYVSHLHADHHIGLIGVIQARRRALEETSKQASGLEPLYLLAPGQIMSWLSVYDRQFEGIRDDFTLIPNQALLKSYTNRTSIMTPAILAALGLEDISTCLVSHCPNAFGVALTIDPSNKVTYSGDTIPCDALVELGKDSTLLIHEATMEDELADEARVKMHSTTSQAIEIGQKMQAKYTVLTHFSQRYARLPRLSSHILNDNNSVGIAFDNMQITMSDLKLLPHLYAPLQLMFAEHCVEMELKAAHRARKAKNQDKSPEEPPKKLSREQSNDKKAIEKPVESEKVESS